MTARIGQPGQVRLTVSLDRSEGRRADGKSAGGGQVGKKIRIAQPGQER